VGDQRDGGIAWTDETWSPIRGCDDVSPGCRACYAKSIAARFSGPGEPYEGLAKFVDAPGDGSKRRRLAKWSGAGARFIAERLPDPLRWRRPRTVFVNSMSDVFHASLSNEEIAAIFGVMAAAPRHTFQVLTKRAERMAEWFAWIASNEPHYEGEPFSQGPLGRVRQHAQHYLDDKTAERIDGFALGSWPLSNVWLGVTAEDQQRADERIPILMATPAAVRWASCEPLLEQVSLHKWLGRFCGCACAHGPEPEPCDDYMAGRKRCPNEPRGLDLVVIGGERSTSAGQARSMDLEWAYRLVRQCRDGGRTKAFVKQLGDDPQQRTWSRSRRPEASGGYWTSHCDHVWRYPVTASGGADPSEWPADLRVREMPEAHR
jgi:protein gp37